MTSISAIQVYLKKRLAVGDFEFVFEYLLKNMNEDSSLFNMVLINQFRHIQIKNENIKGVIQHNDYTINLSKIGHSIIEIVGQIQTHDLKTELSSNESLLKFADVVRFIEGRMNDLSCKFNSVKICDKIEHEMRNEIRTSESRVFYSGFRCKTDGEFEFNYNITTYEKIYYNEGEKYHFYNKIEEHHKVSSNIKYLSKVSLKKDFEYDCKNIELLTFDTFNGSYSIFHKYRINSTYGSTKQSVRLDDSKETREDEKKLKNIGLIVDSSNDVKDRLLNAFDFLLNYFESPREIF